MITVEEAQRLIAESAPRLRKESMVPLAALGSILAEDIPSPFDLPHFDNSAMDGFALRSEDTREATALHPVRLEVCGVARAGDRPAELSTGESVRIMTGAPVPLGADTVIPLEKAEAAGNELIFKSPWPAACHVRRRGEELQKGQTVILRGNPVHPAVVGILASLGIKRVPVFAKPRVALISTGSELVEPGRPLALGKIYDSNTHMLRAALRDMDIHPEFVKRLSDQPGPIRRVTAYALRSSDCVILMGGVSTGDTDHVKPALEALGVRPIFWKVSQKPGKPLYFGKKGNTLVFGLPGNPAAVFTCFYEYVYPALRRMMGRAYPRLKTAVLPLAGDIKPDPDKTLFLKARVDMSGGRARVLPLKGQASHMLASLGEANALITVPGGVSILENGSDASVNMLPYSEVP